MQHAEALAQSLDAELHVLRVLPARLLFVSELGRLFQVKNAPREVHPWRSAARRMASWCNDVLSQPLPAGRLAVRVGDFVSQVELHSRALPDPVIVLPPSKGRLGLTATTLACASLRSVLVVRAWARAATVLVATGLEKGDTSVLQKALALGRQLRAPVVALHNITRNASTMAAGSPLLAPLSLAPLSVRAGTPSDEAQVADVRERLGSVSAIVTNERDLADAIIHQARWCRAHTIVVGTRRRSWFEHLIRPSVASAVIDGADRSVLVSPRRQ